MDLFKPILSRFSDRLKKIDDEVTNNGDANKDTNKTIESNEIFKLASDSFIKLNQAYDLKYNENDWRLCLLYLACEKQHIYMNKAKQLPFKAYHSLIGDETSSGEIKHERNDDEKNISFSSLLKLSDLKASNFVRNILKTLRMVNASSSLHDRLEKLESKFNVSSVLFKKYHTIFHGLFRQFATNLVSIFDQNNVDQNEDHSTRTYLRTDPEMFDLNDLFEFGWLLFILIKEFYPQVSSDLVNSYHLLVCSANFLLISAITSKSSIRSKKSKKISNCEIIYKNQECEPLKIKTINEHYFIPRVEESCSNIFDVKFIDLNKIRSINMQLTSIYKSMLKKNNVVGLSLWIDFDDTIFLIAGERETTAKLLRNDENHTVEISIPSSLEHAFKSEGSFQLRSIVEDLLNPNEVEEFDEFLKNEKFSCLLKDEIWNRIDICNQDGFSQFKIDMEKFVDSLIKLTKQFYYHVISKILYNEKRRISADSFMKFLKAMKLKNGFYQSIYVCCFETILNFGQVSIRNIQEYKQSTECEKSLKVIEYFSLISDEKLTFPWSLKCLNIEPFEFVRFIELFIKTYGNVQSNVHMTTTIATNGIKKTVYSSTTPSSINKSEEQSSSEFYLDREIVRYFSTCESQIVENLAWKRESPIWEKLSSLELNLNYSMSVRSCDIEMGAHLNTSLLFPLYDDVFYPNESIVGGPANKQSNTLTRVVCNQQTVNSYDSGVLISTNKLGKKIQVITLAQSNASQTPSKSSTHNRLVNLNFYLVYFFRKFYILAGIRIKYLINKLNLVNMYADRVSGKSSSLSSSSSSSLSLSSTPVKYPLCTPNNLNGVNIIPNGISNFSQAQLFETYQILYKKIWLIFEHAIGSSSENEESLLKNRHMDQIIMCSIYIVCRISSIDIHFKDILAAYRQLSLTSNSKVYREVSMMAHEQPQDIVTFYNKIFVLKLKSYSFDLSKQFKQLPQSPSPMSTPSSSSCLPSHFITPVNSSGSITNLANGGSSLMKNSCLSGTGTLATPTASVQFSPRKILTRNSVFISPTKTCTASAVGSAHSVSNRNKLNYSLRNRDLVKSMKLINDMIKKNEIKIKTSNKRLFSEISSQNVLPNVAATTAMKNDESDGNNEKIKSLENNCEVVQNFTRHNSSFLINSNVNRSSFINIGPNFSKKLKTVLKEKPTLD